jgi:hypothetical protein
MKASMKKQDAALVEGDAFPIICNHPQKLSHEE